MLPKGFLELARTLIGANTVSSQGTRQAADLLQTLWEHAGLPVRRQVVEEVHVNILGGPGFDVTGEGGVLLVTHLDTVPPGPLERWHSDPWMLTERDGFLDGLGVADVKLDALCKAEAARRVQGRRARRPFWLLGTFGEEVGLRGSRHFAGSELFREVSPTQVLCGEPSELRIISAHKGYAVVRCTIRDRKARPVNSEGPGIEQLQFAGKAAHSSTPHLGDNAILKALEWVKTLEAAIAIQLDARLLPGQDPDALIARFTEQAQAWVRELGHGELDLEVSVERNAAGLSLPDDSALVKSVGAVLARHGLDPAPRAKPTSTEAGVFARAGCEAVVIGPGRSTGNAHTPDERIEMAQLEKACDLYESLLVELCACT